MENRRQEFRLTVITGAMSSGKNTLLIDIIERDNIEYRYVASKDNTPTIHSRDGRVLEAIKIDSFERLVKMMKIQRVEDTTILVDEIQFLEDYDNIKALIEFLVQHNITMYAAGLDLDSDNCVFTSVAMMMCYATRVVKLSSSCSCGRQTRVSNYIQQHTKKKEQIEVGQDNYEQG